MENENLNRSRELARINQLIRSGDIAREIEHLDKITSLIVMGDYFVELTIDKKTRELKGIEIREDSETLIRYYKENVDHNSEAA